MDIWLVMNEFDWPFVGSEMWILCLLLLQQLSLSMDILI